ncbi:hypothetical protein M0812_02354 [Anaeramoeba flamelloides]|uniref:Transmembrane protein n=1 Tax=Anaeramoeba flamelloides TaxID=1746091 RepID=A0AAV7YZQ6_9EUKA|nr:hypothetical protein M0812_02354 [Anaeramoeba flamelloides]
MSLQSISNKHSSSDENENLVELVEIDNEFEEEEKKTKFTKEENQVEEEKKSHTKKFLMTFVSMLVISVIVFLFRYLSKPLVPLPPKTRPKMPSPGWCEPKKPIFYYDLGGTECACEEKWSRKTYWSKMMTGFAFNFPHVISPFHFQMIFVNWKYVFMGIYLNEVLEELMMGVGGIWGFTFDPPMDAEARYDSLIRDFVCCMSGLKLGSFVSDMLQIPPLVKLPIVWNFDSSNPHSAHRLFKGFVQCLILSQMTLVYNSDRGKGFFNKTNVVLMFGYTLLIGLFYLWNKNDYSNASSRRKILVHHIFWVFCVNYILSFTIHPTLDAMYMIFIAEISLTMILYIFETCLRLNLWDLRKKIGLEEETIQINNKIDPEENVKELKKQKFDRNKLMSYINMLEIQTNKTSFSFKDLEKSLVKFQKFQIEKSKKYIVSKKRWICLSIFFIIGIILIVILSQTPLLYDGDIMYKRHWCGNPAISGVNGCYNWEYNTTRMEADIY